MNWRRMVRLAALLAMLGTAGQAQQTAFEVLDRRGDLLGWEAIGRVETSRGYCTGTLIARDLVLTAAHCVYRGSLRIPAEQIRFRAGYHHGRSIADRQVRRVAVAAGYGAGQGDVIGSQDIARDVALLQLDRPVHAAEADPFALLSAPPDGTEVSVVSYGRGRDEALSRQASCHMKQRYRGGVMAFDCDITYGSSGSPVFVREAGRPRILAVISAMKTNGPDKIALAVELPAHVAALRQELRAAQSQPPVTSGAKRVRVGERAVTGARFVRP